MEREGPLPRQCSQAALQGTDSFLSESPLLPTNHWDDFWQLKLFFLEFLHPTTVHSWLWLACEITDRFPVVGAVPRVNSYQRMASRYRWGVRVSGFLSPSSQGRALGTPGQNTARSTFVPFLLPKVRWILLRFRANRIRVLHWISSHGWKANRETFKQWSECPHQGPQKNTALLRKRRPNCYNQVGKYPSSSEDNHLCFSLLKWSLEAFS